MHELNEQELLAHLNKQTAKISWQELERAFAQGLVFKISGELDLLEVAVAFIHDKAETIKQHMDQGRLAKVDDEQAALWQQDNKIFWATVATPWILIQALEDKKTKTKNKIKPN